MDNNNFDSVPQNNTNEPYTVNNIPVTEQPQPQYQQPAPAPQPQYQQPYQQYPVQPAVVDPGKDNATIAMILGIVSIVFGATIAIGLGCGIAAIILAKKSREATLGAGLQRRTEEKVGFITGIIGTVLAGLALAGVIISVLLPIFFALLALPFAAMS